VRVGGLFGNIKRTPTKPSLFDGVLATPAPSPAVDWEAYFKSFETTLAVLKLDHAETPRFLGTMLTGLQSLLCNEKVLSLQVDSGFTIANVVKNPLLPAAREIV
jgi:hypothetical protein